MQISAAVRRTLYVLIVYSGFCLVTLTTPDRALFQADDAGSVVFRIDSAKLTLPLLQIQYPFTAFLFAGPVFLVALLTYLHIYIGYGARLRLETGTGAELATKSVDFILDLDHPLARILGKLLFYWSGPIVLFAFAWKASPFSASGWTAAFALGTTIAMLWLQIHRGPPVGTLRVVLRGLLLLLLLGLFIPSFLAAVVTIPLERSGEYSRLKLEALGNIDTLFADNPAPPARWQLFSRRLNLTQSNFARKNLRQASFEYVRFTGSNMADANMAGARLVAAELQACDLRQIRLENATLMWIDMRDANLGGARFRHAVLMFVDLSGADLTGADLRDTTIMRTNLKDAVLESTILDDVDLGWIENVTKEQLVRSCLTPRTVKTIFGDAHRQKAFLDQYQRPASCPELRSNSRVKQ